MVQTREEQKIFSSITNNALARRSFSHFHLHLNFLFAFFAFTSTGVGVSEVRLVGWLGGRRFEMELHSKPPALNDRL